MFDTVTLIVFTLILTIKRLAALGTGAEPAARHTGKAQMRHQAQSQQFLHRR